MRLLSRDRLHTNNPLLESMNDPRSGSKAWEALDRGESSANDMDRFPPRKSSAEALDDGLSTDCRLPGLSLHGVRSKATEKHSDRG